LPRKANFWTWNWWEMEEKGRGRDFEEKDLKKNE